MENIKHILTQTPVFNAVINNLEGFEDDQINFSKAIGMLEHLYLIAKQESDLWFAILEKHVENLSCCILETLGDYEWETISGHPMSNKRICPFSDNFIRKYADKFDFDILSQTYTLSESIIREFFNKIDWTEISLQYLSDEFVDEFSDKLDLYTMSEKSELSEDFIRRFESKVDWEMISANQALFEELILEFAHKIDFNALLRSSYSLNDSFIAYLLTRAYQ